MDVNAIPLSFCRDGPRALSCIRELEPTLWVGRSLENDPIYRTVLCFRLNTYGVEHSKVNLRLIINPPQGRVSPTESER